MLTLATMPRGLTPQADEHLAGKMPSHGTETCAVVEAIVSLAASGGILGDAALFERAERVTYNAMPAATTKDTWARVYLQQSNEIWAVHEDPSVFATDGADSAMFGLETNYGCCTANMHAGWPKFTAMALGSSADGSVGVLMWAPVQATFASGTVSVVTDYPFGDSATVTVTPTGTAPLPVFLRIPSWATGATLAVNGGSPMPLGPLVAGTFYRTETVGAAGTATTYVVNFAPAILMEEFTPGGAVTIVRGALVYSVWLGENFTVTSTHPFESRDYAIHATSSWNVALVLDRANPGASLTFKQLAKPRWVSIGCVAYTQSW